MESTMMTAQAIPSNSYYYYSPEQLADNRHHAHFSQQPAMQPHMAMFPLVPAVPSMPIYSRPNSACSQPTHIKAFNNPNATLGSNGPAPKPAGQRPTLFVHEHASKLMVETDLHGSDRHYYPATPPLSSAASVISSPDSCDALATPMNPMFSGLDGFEGMKEPCEIVDINPEQLQNLEWSNCASPTITPIFLQQSFPGKAASPSGNRELLSLSSCPSLSPSPSPYARSVASEQDVDFCDPRNLTVVAGHSSSSSPVSSPAVPTDLPALPALCGSDEERKFLRGESFVKLCPTILSPASPLDFNSSTTQPFPQFEDISEFDSSDEDFIVGHNSIHTVPRSRTCSSALSIGNDSFSCDNDFEDLTSLSSPPSSCSDSDCHRDKRVKKSKESSPKKISPAMSAAAETPQSGSDQPPVSASQAPPSESKTSSGSDASAPPPAPTSRRGRKQSLTEDPSKTFVCDLCNRRFRRQEHLKRHYRSLHTQEKPFECQECGKKFSRSDNLSQHARTHGSGAIVMNLIDDVEGGLEHMMVGPHEDYATFGKVLFQVAAEIPGSASEYSSEEGGSDVHGKKKRKRSD